MAADPPPFLFRNRRRLSGGKNPPPFNFPSSIIARGDQVVMKLCWLVKMMINWLLEMVITWLVEILIN